jgi:ribonuclease-3
MHHKLCLSLNYRFKNNNLLELALTHPSYQQDNYERLEFLGDRVLGLIMADFLLQQFPDESEGSLSKRQATLVSSSALLTIAQNLQLSNFLKLGNGEKKTGGRYNQNNLTSALEAVIAAIYLDSDFYCTKKIVIALWGDLLQQNINSDPHLDSVSRVQEFVQNRSKELPLYIINKINESEHQPIFEATLKIIFLDLVFVACGNTKKQARQNVAKKAMDFLKSL